MNDKQEAKILALAAVVAGVLAFIALPRPLPIKTPRALAAVVAGVPEPSKYLQALFKFYAQCGDCVDKSTLTEATYYTEQAARQLCLEDQVDTMLAMWVTESHFDPKTTDEKLVGYKNRSLGIAQTKRKYFKRIRAAWLKRGIKLGPFGSIKTQVYFGVMEFYEHLLYTRGNVKEAVRSYNGGGRGGKGLVKARRYANAVMKRRARIFGRPHQKDETAAYYKECR